MRLHIPLSVNWCHWQRWVLLRWATFTQKILIIQAYRLVALATFHYLAISFSHFLFHNRFVKLRNDILSIGYICLRTLSCSAISHCGSHELLFLPFFCVSASNAHLGCGDIDNRDALRRHVAANVNHAHADAVAHSTNRALSRADNHSGTHVLQ